MDAALRDFLRQKGRATEALIAAQDGTPSTVLGRTQAEGVNARTYAQLYPDADIWRRDADGNVRILIAGVGPGESQAVITTTAPMPLTSSNGKTVGLGENKYRFTGQDICSDILSGGK
jgi:hypothetical protein